MLQESHSSQSKESFWNVEFRGTIYYSYGTSESRDVCILIKNNIDIDVKDFIEDIEGRYNQLNVMLEGKSLPLVNLYGRNKDNPDFFTKVRNKVETADIDFEIIAGDFICVLDNEMDKLCGKALHANKKSWELLNVW